MKTTVPRRRHARPTPVSCRTVRRRRAERKDGHDRRRRELLAYPHTGFVRDTPDELPAAIQMVDGIDPRVCRERIAGRFDVDAMVEGYEHAYRAELETASRPG